MHPGTPSAALSAGAEGGGVTTVGDPTNPLFSTFDDKSDLGANYDWNVDWECRRSASCDGCCTTTNRGSWFYETVGYPYYAVDGRWTIDDSGIPGEGMNPRYTPYTPPYTVRAPGVDAGVHAAASSRHGAVPRPKASHAMPTMVTAPSTLARGLLGPLRSLETEGSPHVWLSRPFLQCVHAPTLGGLERRLHRPHAGPRHGRLPHHERAATGLNAPPAPL